MRNSMLFLAICIGLRLSVTLAATNPAGEMQRSLGYRPGSYVGIVPGGYLTGDMRPLPESELQNVPVIDMDAVCRSQRSFSLNVCINSAQEAYDGSKIYWSSASMNSRDVCINIAAKAALKDSEAMTSYYGRLENCLQTRADMESAVRQLNNTHFQP